MPSSALKSIADKSSKSLDDVERYWNDAKKQMDKSEADFTDSDWAQVMAITKKRAGVNESILKEFLQCDKSSKEFLQVL